MKKLRIDQNISLAPFTSWLIGGEAEFICFPKTIEQLQEAQRFAQEKKIVVTILGGGSNVLISDQGVRGLVICLKNFNQLEVTTSLERVAISAFAGAGKSELLRVFLKHKLSPALFLAGLPGQVGGGVVMNAGVAESFHPREFVDFTDWVEVLKPDGSLVLYKKEDLRWEYRHCSGWEPGIVTRVGISWENRADDSILVQVREANRTRLLRQPLDMPSCGSVFVNPPGYKAAQLIDSCGLKGYAVGGALVSTKHANFIVNSGQATAEDILQIINHVQKMVFSKTGVELKTEVVRLGF